jgi:hypothetical protein
MPLVDTDDLAHATVKLETDLEIACAAGAVRLDASIEITMVR